MSGYDQSPDYGGPEGSRAGLVATVLFAAVGAAAVYTGFIKLIVESARALF